MSYPGCDLSLSYGLTVTVRGGALTPLPPDAPAPVPIPPGDGDGTTPSECQAKVIAIDGGYSEVLECFGDFNGDCYCYGAPERAGTYEVTVTWGSKTETQVATVRAGECHVSGQDLTFFDDLRGAP
jgi:hypothetical protein